MNKNIRSYSQDTKFRMVLIFLIILFTLGLGLIWLIYGFRSALLGLFCLIGSAIPIGLIGLFLFGLDKLVKKEE